MLISASRLLFLLRLACAFPFRGSSAQRRYPCKETALVFDLMYVPRDNTRRGFVGLQNSFPAVLAVNGSVVRTHPCLSGENVSVELSFVERQAVTVRDLRAAVPSASIVDVSYHCELRNYLSCMVVCRFGGDYVQFFNGRMYRGTKRHEGVERVCSTQRGVSIIGGGWTKIAKRWSDLCAAMERRESPSKVSFRYDPDRRAVICDVSLFDPVECLVRIVNDTRIVTSADCTQRRDLTVGVAISHRVERPEDADPLACLVSGEFFSDVTTSLEPRNRSDDRVALSTVGPGPEDVPKGGQDGDRGVGTGPIVGVTCAVTIVVAVTIFAWMCRRRLGLRFSSRRTEASG